MMCPAGCETPLVMSERQNVEIDYCPTCRGVWLDRGELDKIIERVNSSMLPPPPVPAQANYGDRGDERRRFDRDDDRHRSYKPKKKRESFLSEIFEFG